VWLLSILLGWIYLVYYIAVEFSLLIGIMFGLLNFSILVLIHFFDIILRDGVSDIQNNIEAIYNYEEVRFNEIAKLAEEDYSVDENYDEKIILQ
jgi:hypothetical protein